MKTGKLLAALALLLLLTGCHGKMPLSSSYHDIENAELIRTICVDREGSKILVSAFGENREKEDNVVWQGEGESFGEALASLANYQGKELLFSHTDFLLAGAGLAGQDICAVLDYVERATDFRMSCKLCRLQQGIAGESAQSLQEQGDITAQLMGIAERLPNLSEGQMYSCSECISGLKEEGFALLMNLQEENILQAVGYSVLTAGEELRLLSAEEAKGVTVLRNREISGQLPLYGDDGSGYGEIFVRRTKVSKKNEVFLIELSVKLQILQNPQHIPRSDIESRTAEKIKTEIVGAYRKQSLWQLNLLKLPTDQGRENSDCEVIINVCVFSEGEITEGESGAGS